MDVELSKLTTKFSENVLDSTNAFELVVTDESKLAGLPPTAMAAARQSAAAKNLDGWRFTLQAPSLTPVLTYLDDRGIREQVYRAHSTRATQGELDNRELVARILELRKAKAHLLGFANFADFVLQDRMAHTGAHALEFLTASGEENACSFRTRERRLREFAGGELEPWDVGLLRGETTQGALRFRRGGIAPLLFDREVVSGMFEIVERLYGIQVVEKSGVPVWHPDVKYYQIRDEVGQFLGGFLCRLVSARGQTRRRVDGRIHHRRGRTRKVRASRRMHLREHDCANWRCAGTADAIATWRRFSTSSGTCCITRFPAWRSRAWLVRPWLGISWNYRRRSWRTGAGSARRWTFLRDIMKPARPFRRDLFEKMRARAEFPQRE